MKTCPLCEGRRFVTRVVPSDNGERLHLPGGSVPINYCVSVPCHVCKCAGTVAEDGYRSMSERWRLATD